MKKEEYILLSELGERQRQLPGAFPIFKKIRKVDGQLVGEIEGYSDQFGNRLDSSPLPQKKYH